MSRFNYSTSFDRDSDASEADQHDIDKILKDTMDLDAGLFGTKSKNTNLSKTLPSSNNKSESVMQRNRSFNFEDDPTADIDTIIGKSKQNVTNSNAKSGKQISFESDKSNPLASTMSASVSFSPSTNKTVQKSSIFDDDDNGLLDKMGLDSKQKGKTASRSINENLGQTKSKSLVDELFGKSSSVKEEKNEPHEFKLNDRYLSMSQQQSVSKTNDDDYQFGGYVPSAISNTPRTNATSNKRNVNFTDDLFGSNGGADLSFTMSSPSRPKTTSALDKNTNLSKTMPEPIKDDWLGIVDSKQSSKKNSNDSSLDELLRPRSDSITKANSNALKQTNNNNNNDLDWLGFKDKDSDILSNSNNNIRNVINSPSKSKPPPAPTTHSSALNSPVNHLDDKHQNKFFNNNKESMNSSFADSIDNNIDNIPSTAIITQSNANNILNVLNNIQPIKTLDTTASSSMQKQQSKEHESNSVAPSDGEDGWLNALITKKNDSKRPLSNDIINSEKRYNAAQIEAITNKLTTNNNTSTNSLAVSNAQNVTKFKTSFNMNEQAVQYDSNEIQAMLQKIKQLEYENQDLHMQLQHNKSHYELQIQLIQDSCENRVRMIKEDRDNSVRLFKDEKEALQAHIDSVEKEKLQIALSYKKKTDDVQREYDVETEKLRQIQRDTIEKLKEDHEEALRRVRHMKDTEIDAAMAATSHTRTIESVLNLIEDNAKNLDGLSEKVKMGHMINLNEHEVQLRNKEETLRLQEERLLKKQKEYENEIRSLNETIQRLENHLAEQSKSMAEERWKGKQHEKKMEALQDALLNEQRIVMERLSRERNDIERSKDDILNEQKRLMQQLYEEKRKIAEERAQVEATVAAYKDKQHKDSLNNINIEAEISVLTRRLNDEKARVEQMMRELKEKEAKLEQEKAVLDDKKQQLETKSIKIEQMAAIVNKKYSEAEELFNKSAKEREMNVKIMEQVNHVKSTQESRLNQIQQQLANANEREAQLNKEKIDVYKQRQELELFKSSITCNKCKEPVKDFGLLGLSLPTSGYGTYIQANLMSTQTSQTFKSPLFGLQTTESTLEDSKLLRQLKMQALKDRQFINEEKHFIETLGRNNSLNLLN